MRCLACESWLVRHDVRRAWLMSYIRASRDSCRTYIRVMTGLMSYLYASNDSYVMTYDVHHSCRTYEWVMHVVHMNESHSCTSYIWMSLIHHIVACHIVASYIYRTCEWVMHVVYMYDMTHDSLVYTTWLIHMVHAGNRRTTSCDVHDAFICTTRLIHIYRWVMSHVMYDVHDSCRTYEWVMHVVLCV